MSFAHFNLITDDDLHDSLRRIASIGSPHPNSVTLTGVTEQGGGASGIDLLPVDLPGASAVPFNLDACFKMGEG